MMGGSLHEIAQRGEEASVSAKAMFCNWPPAAQYLELIEERHGESAIREWLATAGVRERYRETVVASSYYSSTSGMFAYGEVIGVEVFIHVEDPLRPGEMQYILHGVLSATTGDAAARRLAAPDTDESPAVVPQWCVHKSVGPQNNGRLIFLGASILDLLVSRELYALMPEAGEHELREMRTRLLDPEQLAWVSRQLGLDRHGVVRTDYLC
eukprot:gnl/TRDRNA2_/TRDRNA2_173418_c0_seq16.p1 gnl/TRDRNA2_/TRDRNA2_173418_c0~~gnl/TRDRNA2_/TRDRNA2_173418_c0_seq16.p1  ORF type:complete len:211 (-),score=23.50 gnl/TRDRNA2_/TRDRNA2_173418_c0_seq16:432-1064(-)